MCTGGYVLEDVSQWMCTSGCVLVEASSSCGGATFAFRLGMDPLLIKRMRDWMSDAYMRYIEHHTPEGLVRLPRTLAAACAVHEKVETGCGVGSPGWVG